MKTKILIISDTHGYIDPLYGIISREKPDNLFFLGDCIRDIEYIEYEMPSLPVCKISGNNDFFRTDGNVKPERIFYIEEHKFMLCHGHNYKVKASLKYILSAAKANGAECVLFGHTHKVCDTVEDGVRLVNPGSFRDSGTYAVAEVSKDKIDIYIKNI